MPGSIFVEHERIEFVSFPYEWSGAMLAAAAELTLDIAERCLRDGFALKDATPYNVLFRGPRPVFIDVLSFEEHDPSECTWMAYAQFLRTFIFPLIACRHFGRGLDDIFLTHRDGLEPEEIYGALSGMRRLLPPFLGLVSLPTWLGRSRRQGEPSFYNRRRKPDPNEASFILQSVLKSLRKKVAAAAPRINHAFADDYMNRDNNYASDDAETKDRVVRDVISSCSPSRVLDIGCNNGHFSRIAAASGAQTVGLDRSPEYVDAVWDMASRSGLDILPLHINLARPSAGTGWNNSECPSFLDRARGHFDMVFMLAVVHHLTVTERIPLDAIMELLSELTTRHVLIEFVSKDDSMFQRLTRGREELHTHFTQGYFEAACLKRFRLARTYAYRSPHRRLYLLEKR